MTVLLSSSNIHCPTLYNLISLHQTKYIKFRQFYSIYIYIYICNYFLTVSVSLKMLFPNYQLKLIIDIEGQNCVYINIWVFPRNFNVTE